MREFIHLACVWGIALCGVLSLWPFRFSQRWQSWNLYLPLAGITLYAVYEASLPAQADIGGEMAVLLPLLLFLVLNSMAKVAVLQGMMKKANGSRRQLRGLPQRRLQLLVAVPIFLGCAIWCWMRCN